jgi:hypothetical protein
VTGGILSGRGTIEGPVTIGSGGTLAPGGSIGALTVAGRAVADTAFVNRGQRRARHGDHQRGKCATYHPPRQLFAVGHGLTRGAANRRWHSAPAMAACTSAPNGGYDKTGAVSGLYTRAVTVFRDTLSEGFSHFVTCMTAPVASGWSGLPGGFRTHWKAPPFHGAREERTSAKSPETAWLTLRRHHGLPTNRRCRPM